jgi:hypothetical protein
MRQDSPRSSNGIETRSSRSPLDTRHDRSPSSDQSREATRGPDRDIDLLVEFESDSSLFDLMSLEDALRDLLGRPVDVVSAGALRDRDDDIRGDLLRL